MAPQKQRNGAAAADARLRLLAAEIEGLAGSASVAAKHDVVSRLAVLLGPAEQRAASGLGSSSPREVGSANQDANLWQRLRNVPVLFADEHPRRLCSAKPPWGLLSKDVSQLGAPANWSRLRQANRTREHIHLCQLYAARMLQKGSLGKRPPLPSNHSCAIVGSGGGLRGSSYGQLIDEHKTVMRFNAAPAGGEWAQDVGQRTTLRIYTDKTIAHSARRDDLHVGADGRLLYCMASWVGKCMHAGVRAPSEGANKLWLINPVFVRHLRSMLDSQGGRGR